MSRPAFFKFYADDFVASVRRRAMTPEEVGAYVMFLCWQWQEQKPVPDDPRRYNAFTGWDPRLAKRLLARLTGIGVVQSSEDGLYNERMTEEITKYCVRVKASIQREERRRENENKPEMSDSYPDSYPDSYGVANRIANDEVSENISKNNEDQSTAGGISRSQKPEARIKTLGQTQGFDLVGGEAEKPAPKARPRPRPTEQQFTDFWDAYPRRVKKAEARKKFFLLNPDAADLAIDGARAYAREVAMDVRDPSKVMHPTTYLNQRVYEDLKDASQGAPEPDPVNGKAWGFWREEIAQWRSYSPQAWRLALDRAKPNGTWPWWNLGPPPGHPECLVHPTVLAERGLVEIYRGKIQHD